MRNLRVCLRTGGTLQVKAEKFRDNGDTYTLLGDDNKMLAIIPKVNILLIFDTDKGKLI